MLSGDDEHGRLSPLLAFDSEQLVATSHRQWAAVQNLDTFFQKISRRPWSVLLAIRLTCMRAHL